MRSSSLPDYTRWIARASNVELSRAVTEERQAFVPEALRAMSAEVRRRALCPEEVMCLFRRSRARSLRSDRWRLVLGGVLLAGLGGLPGFLLRTVQLRFAVLLDNTDGHELEVWLGTHRLLLAPRSRREVHMTLEERQSPVRRWWREARGGEEAGTLELAIRLLSKAPGASPSEARARVREGGRYLLGGDPMTRYVLSEQVYLVQGAIARRDGAPRRAPVECAGPLLDLDDLVFPGRGRVPLHFVDGGFPQVLELPADGRRATRLCRYLLSRID